MGSAVLHDRLKPAFEKHVHLLQEWVRTFSGSPLQSTVLLVSASCKWQCCCHRSVSSWWTSRICLVSQGLEVKVWRDYEQFLAELGDRFPHERKGIRKFYDECWRVFNSLNSLELKSLEEPRYLLGRKSAALHA